jgi:hypothetical protein
MKTLENLEEMDKFLDTYDHLKLNNEYINHLSRNSNKESSKKNPGLLGFFPKFYQNLGN